MSLHTPSLGNLIGAPTEFLFGAAASSKSWIRDQIVWFDAMRAILHSSERSWDGQIIDLSATSNRQFFASQSH